MHLAPSDHLVQHVKEKYLRSDNTLHVVGVVANPVRYNSRYRLAREFIARMKQTPHVELYVVESAFGDRVHEITEKGNPKHLQLRTKSEIWTKENMINLGVQHLLPRDWKYVAWIDMDVEFRNPGWALETIHQLQHFPILQPWQTVVNKGPTENGMKLYPSTGWQIHKGISPVKKDGHTNGDPYVFGHCGYAWACTRAFWENVRGLVDFAILGSADHHMAMGCRGLYSRSVHGLMKGPFLEHLELWQTRAMQVTHGVVGYVPGGIEHNFHGPMHRRNYVGRWNILIDHKYNPVTDLRHDDQGMIQITKPELEYAIRLYNRSRYEDSIEED